eukprot:XP_001698530.1 cyclin [Chlamydomonas reinhardtii]
MNYINRFFLTRSIAKNDRHCVVGGAILLASKVQESPRPVQDVAYVLLQAKNANKQQKQKQAPDQTTLEQFKDAVVLAEQAMLFAVNFNLNVETHVSLARGLLQPLDLLMVKNPAPEQADSNQLKIGLYSAVMIFLNDSAMTNLSLQYASSQIAPVSLILAAKRISATPRFAGKPLPAELQKVLALANDHEWLAQKGLTVEQVADIESQINELYATAPAPAGAQQQQQAPAAAATEKQQAQPQAMAATSPPEEGEVAAVGGSGRAEACPCSPDDNGCVSVAGGSQCRPGQPSSSVAAGPTGGMATAGNTPEQPQRESVLASCHKRKRVSECEDTDQQATSELHAAPAEQEQLQAPADEGEGVGQAPCGASECERQAHAAVRAAVLAMEDSANENGGSPNGLTAGNASGSGCCVAEGQPEVCSHQEAAAAAAAVSSQRAQKRGREPEEGCCVADCGEADAVHAGKVARLEADIAA